MITDVLTDLGLSPEESEVYESLLDNGSQSAIELSHSTKVKRTNIYNIASGLVKRGLVSQGERRGTTIYVPLSPDKLLSLVHDKKEQVLRVEQTLEAVLPGLKSKYNLIDTKPVVTYYEGVEGVKKVYMDTIKEGGEICALVETSEVNQDIYYWVTDEYVKDRVKQGISVKAIVASGEKTKVYTGLNESELRETKIISSEKFPFENEINIYGDKVALINHKKGGKLIGVIIDNKLIANTFRSWFDLTWSKL